MTPGRLGRLALAAAPAAFLGLFFLYPLATIVERGLRGEGDSPLDVLTDPTTADVVWFTVWQALASTALTIAIALPAAYVRGRFRFGGLGEKDDLAVAHADLVAGLKERGPGQFPADASFCRPFPPSPAASDGPRGKGAA